MRIQGIGTLRTGGALGEQTKVTGGAFGGRTKLNEDCDFQSSCCLRVCDFDPRWQDEEEVAAIDPRWQEEEAPEEGAAEEVDPGARAAEPLLG